MEVRSIKLIANCTDTYYFYKINKLSDGLIIKMNISDTAEEDAESKQPIALCASCDRCRARKTKCDGNRPCSNCAGKYMKKHRLNSIEGIAIAEIECVYSPAKRRGPVPGRTNQTRKQANRFASDWIAPNVSGGVIPTAQSLKEMQLRQIQNSISAGAGTDTYFNSQQIAIQRQLNLIQQMQNQQNGGERSGVRRPHEVMSVGNSGNISSALPPVEPPAARRIKLDHQHVPTVHLQQYRQQFQQLQQQQQDQHQSSVAGLDSNGVPKTIAAHTHLLELSDPDGSRLRAYYRLSVDEVFGFPPIPTDEEYCIRLNVRGMTPRMIPGTHLAALSAARFAEVSLGAIVHNEISLAMELCNAVVHCLKESVQEPVQPPYMFEVARSYFLLAVFRSFRGDMERYFKYRRVCLTYVSKLEVRAPVFLLSFVALFCIVCSSIAFPGFHIKLIFSCR